MSEVRQELLLWQSYCEKKMALEDAQDEIEKLRAAVQDLAKHIWRGDWDKLKPETRELLGESAPPSPPQSSQSFR
jgi:hypothetical protein